MKMGRIKSTRCKWGIFGIFQRDQLTLFKVTINLSKKSRILISLGIDDENEILVAFDDGM